MKAQLLSLFLLSVPLVMNVLSGERLSDRGGDDDRAATRTEAVASSAEACVSDADAARPAAKCEPRTEKPAATQPAAKAKPAKPAASKPAATAPTQKQKPATGRAPSGRALWFM